MTHNDDLHADDLQSVIEQLRAHRPEATALELDAVKQRVRSRATRPAGRRARSAAFMKSRLAILFMLATGMLLSTTGAGLAISGLAGPNDASVAQYGDDDDDNGDDFGAVLPEEDGGGSSDTVRGAEDVQTTRQVEAGAQDDGDELPFTGFAAIPVLIGGVALLSTGLVLRRRSGDDRT